MTLLTCLLLIGANALWAQPAAPGTPGSFRPPALPQVIPAPLQGVEHLATPARRIELAALRSPQAVFVANAGDRVLLQGVHALPGDESEQDHVVLMDLATGQIAHTYWNLKRQGAAWLGPKSPNRNAVLAEIPDDHAPDGFVTKMLSLDKAMEAAPDPAETIGDEAKLVAAAGLNPDGEWWIFHTRPTRSWLVIDLAWDEQTDLIKHGRAVIHNPATGANRDLLRMEGNFDLEVFPDQSRACLLKPAADQQNSMVWHHVEVWDLDQAQQVSTRPLSVPVPAEKYHGFITTPGPRWALVCAAESRHVVVIDTTTGKVLAQVGDGRETVFHYDVTPDGRTLVLLVGPPGDDQDATHLLIYDLSALVPKPAPAATTP